MTVRTLRSAVVVAVALVLGAGGLASAQQRAVSGLVRSVDSNTRTVHFVDGRSLLVAPDAVLTVDGQRRSLEEIRPGRALVVQQSDLVAPTTAVAVAETTVVALVPEHPPIDASGTVARVDPQSGLLVFQDGRTVKMTERTTVWQPVAAAKLQPGAQVYVSQALPIGFQSASGPALSGPMVMGTLTQVDTGKTLLVFSDGTLVRLTPEARMQMSGQPVTIAQLKPGDQVVVRIANAPGDSPSALPRETSSPITYQAQEIYIIRITP